MLDAHLPLLIALVASVALGAVILVLSALLGPKRPSAVKEQVFECGNPPSGDARGRFNSKFHLVAVLFLIFDIEGIFIYPWAIVFSDSLRGTASLSPALLLGEMLVFVGIIVTALVYAWRKGALDWSMGT